MEKNKNVNVTEEVITESYFKASETLVKCEKVLELIVTKLKNDPLSDINNSKENILLEKLFEKEFGLGKMCIYWDSKTTPASVGAWNYVSSHILFNKRKPHITINKETGYYDAQHKDRCCLILSPGLVSSIDLTPREMLAVILHEIGHNMDYTAYQATTDIIEKFSDDITVGSNLNKVAKPFYNLAKGVDGLLRSSQFIMNIRDYFSRINLKLIHWSNTYLSPMTTAYLIPILMYTPIYHFSVYWTKRKEVFADSFALAYGYGPEITSALLKLGDRGHLDINIAKDRFADRPFSKFLFNLGIINMEVFQSVVDPHGTNQFRIRKMINNLKSQIKDSGYSQDVITEMELCLARIEEQYESITVANEGDVDSLSKAYRRLIEVIFKGNTDFINRIKKDKQA